MKDFKIDTDTLNFKRNQPATQPSAEAGKMKKANFDIPEGLFYKFKLLAVEMHVTMREAFMEAMNDYMAKHKNEHDG